MTVDQIIKYCGGKTQAAKRFGYTLQTFRNWRKTGVPARAQGYIHTMTKGQLKMSNGGRR